MSYNTTAYLQYLHHREGAIDPSEFKEDLLKMLDERRLHDDVGGDLIDLYSGRS
jgi:hypothetical protein